MSRSSSLYRLQGVDLALDRAKAALQEIHDKLEDQSEIQRLQEDLARAEAELKAARTAHKNDDHASATHLSKIEETDKKLYGGMIKNPKELEDLQQESESLKRHLVTLEDRLLESMVALEEAEFAHGEASQAMADAEQDRAQLEEELGEERTRQVAEVERLETEREACLASVTGDDLTLYEKLRDAKGGKVVSLMEDGCCSACGMSIPPAKQQALRGISDLLICTQCGRILYGG
jgi:predicted  nucleic acid-binding Zn-ribbon protein